MKTRVTLVVGACIIVLLISGMGRSTHLRHTSAHTTTNTPQTLATITGPPDLSADFMNSVLTHANSPAQGLGTTLYRLGRQFHIKPSVALAFFHHESSYGKYGWAAVNQSFGNIRCSASHTLCKGGYRAYPTWDDGALDWFALMSDYIAGKDISSRCPCVTISQIIPVYAPSADENDEAAYIEAVTSDVARWRKGEM